MCFSNLLLVLPIRCPKLDPASSELGRGAQFMQTVGAGRLGEERQRKLEKRKKSNLKKLFGKEHSSAPTWAVPSLQ